MADIIDIFTKKKTKFGQPVKNIDLRGVHKGRNEHIREAGYDPEDFKEFTRTLVGCSDCGSVCDLSLSHRWCPKCQKCTDCCECLVAKTTEKFVPYCLNCRIKAKKITDMAHGGRFWGCPNADCDDPYIDEGRGR